MYSLIIVEASGRVHNIPGSTESELEPKLREALAAGHRAYIRDNLLQCRVGG